MKDKYLKSLIDRLNANNTNGLIHLRPLTDKVEFAKVWTEKPKPTDSITDFEGPFYFYFIKNENGYYVAAVIDMKRVCDLHCFVLPKFRRNGYLTIAMKEVILFHLFQDREEQRITINESQIGSKNFSASENVAKKLGFAKKSDNAKSEYFLTNDKYKTEDYIVGKDTEISKERIMELRKQINFISRSLWVVQTEIDMKLGNNDYSEELKELVDEVRKHRTRIEDVWWSSKRGE